MLLGGDWRGSSWTRTFRANNPKTGEKINEYFPVSEFDEVVKAVEHAEQAAKAVRGWGGERFATFLERYADRLEARSVEICKVAEQETALPFPTRLTVVEMPRTTGQLRQAAQAARVCAVLN